MQDIVRAYVGDFADDVTTDLHGNVIAVQEPGGQAAGHVRRPLRPDRLLISHINDNGFLHAQTIGGWDPQQLIGQRMTI